MFEGDWVNINSENLSPCVAHAPRLQLCERGCEECASPKAWIEYLDGIVEQRPTNQLVSQPARRIVRAEALALEATVFHPSRVPGRLAAYPRGFESVSGELRAFPLKGGSAGTPR
jgi:hypothetical protein